jgi:membrane protein implicated in regulation of membrane protease activity
VHNVRLRGEGEVARLSTPAKGRLTLLVGAVILALLLLPPTWDVPVVLAAAVVEIGEAFLWVRLSRRGRVRMGPETLVGAAAEVVVPCRPNGQVRVQGELWRARCDEGADAGEQVLVRALEGLTLVVERAA